MMSSRRPVRWTALALLLGCTAAQAAPRIDNAWIPQAPPGAGVMAGYFKLHNDSAQTLRCNGVSGVDFGAAEIHRSVVQDGQARMLRDQVVELAPGETAVFERGGLHLMLFRPQRALGAGEQTSLQLRCGEVTVTATFHVKAQH